MRWEDRIVIDPSILQGKPVVKGTRLAVDFVVGLLAEGWSEADILKNYLASNAKTSWLAWLMPATCCTLKASFPLPHCDADSS